MGLEPEFLPPVSAKFFLVRSTGDVEKCGYLVSDGVESERDFGPSGIALWMTGFESRVG